MLLPVQVFADVGAKVLVAVNNVMYQLTTPHGFLFILLFFLAIWVLKCSDYIYVIFGHAGVCDEGQLCLAHVNSTLFASEDKRLLLPNYIQ